MEDETQKHDERREGEERFRANIESEQKAMMVQGRKAGLKEEKGGRAKRRKDTQKE